MIKILLADDQGLIMEGIKAILKHEPEIEIVGTAFDGRSAIALARKLRPDIVLIDVEMPRMNGIMATKYICEHFPDVRVIILTGHHNQDYITQALRAGASGYLLKNSLVEDLKQAIHSLQRGYCYIEAHLLTKAVDRIQTANIAKYQSKITYLKKHRKSVYRPALHEKARRPISSPIPAKVSAKRTANSGISRVSLAPIFDLPTVSEVLRQDSTFSAPFNRPPQKKSFWQSDRKFIPLFIIAIASFVLSLIIF